MRKVEHRLRLDLLRGGNQGYIRVKRGENGARRLAIALYMHSVPYMADAGTTAVFRAIKPDNTKLFNSATVADNVVTVGLTTQTVAALGTVRCELSIYGTNNELLYSPQFDIIVEDYLYSDTAIESTDEYTDLTEAISKVNNIISTEAARIAAENQRVANETARGNAETERETAETARAEAETARATAEAGRETAETDRSSAESARSSNEDIRKQAEKQRVSSETQRNTAETGRSNAESSRRSAETARVQEFNTIKADAQDAATAEATRETNETARVAAETNRANAEQLRVALYNLWNNATASAYGSLSPNVILSNKDGHKHFNFGIPSNSRERYEIEAGELESTALNFTGFTFYNIWESDFQWDANISSYGLPSGINKSFVLITGPAELTESGNDDHSWDVPQTIFDGQNIYMRRLGVSRTGSGSEGAQFVTSYYNKEWEAVGKDAVTYTPQTLTDVQQAQARENIGAEKAGTGYTKPASGIPKSDLEQDVQTSLDKADAAISLGLTSATPGQIIKVKAVQNGKPTEWEAVDMPSEGVEWYEVIDMETAENVNDLVISTDKNGRPISGYHALAMVLCFMIPADSTQTSASGNIWVYPMSDNYLPSGVRTIITVAGWKTITRTFNFLFAGSNRVIFISSASNAATFNEDYNNIFNGIRLYVNGANDHLPTGTKIRCLVLSKGWTA